MIDLHKGPPCVVFLDIDGVLNSDRYSRELAREREPKRFAQGRGVDLCTQPIEDQIDPVAVARLNGLTERFRAAVVIASSWRRHFTVAQIRAALAARGMTAHVLGSVPDRGSFLPEVRDVSSRAANISHWLLDHSTCAWVVLDDAPRASPLPENQVQPDGIDGLTDEDCERATMILSRQLAAQ